VIFVHYCDLQFVYCAAVVVEDLDAVEVCCETVVACVEPEVCDCLFSGFIFVVFRCRFDVLPLCLVGCGDGFLGEFLFCFYCFMNPLIVSKLGDVCLFWSVAPFFVSCSRP
jgi:hypothetical protein